MEDLEFMKSVNRHFLKVPGTDKFMFITGKKTGLFAICIYDLDLYEKSCGPVVRQDTLTTNRTEGGYQKVYKMCAEIEMALKDNKFKKDSSVEVHYDGSGYMYEFGQKILHKIIPDKPLPRTVNFIINNSINNSTIVNSTVNSSVTNSTVINPSQASDDLGVTDVSNKITRSMTSEINSALEVNVDDWTVTSMNDGYKLIPSNRNTSVTCCVDTSESHDPQHSWIVVRKLSVMANCITHGKKEVVDEASIRKLFFNLKGKVGHSREAIELVLSAAESEGMVRHDGQVYKGFRPVASYNEFVRKTMCGKEAQKNCPRLVWSDLETFMEKADDPRFPFVKRDRRYIGFSNGVLDLVEGVLVDDADGFIPRHYIDLPFSAKYTDTPLFDRLVLHQIGDSNVYMYLLGLIGRLLYDVRQFDEFDVVPLVIGDTNTGKSTLAHIIRAMFDHRSVGTLDSKHEIIFGLSSLYRKELIIATEINDKMVHQLSSDTFKNMVCGDAVSVSIKYQDPVYVQWTVPMFMCGNQHISYKDEKGSVSRRLAIFKFEKHVDFIDGSLKNMIIKEELTNIMTKCLLAYRMLIKKSRLGFWKACPDYFHENRDDMTQETDYIYKFLSLGPEDNVWGNRFLYFIKESNSMMLMEDFKNKFFNWLRFKHQNVKYKWTNDYSAFRRLGFDVVQTKVCKVCHKEAQKDCCKFYDNGNRTTRITIKNIKCIEYGDEQTF